MAETYRRETPYARPVQRGGGAVDYALAHSFVREAVVSERKLLTEALKRGLGCGHRRGRATRAGPAAPDPRRAGRAGDGHLPRTCWPTESRLIDFAREGGAGSARWAIPTGRVRRDWFNDGQKAAVRHVLGSRDRVTIIRGAAGTGKTTLEQELGEALGEAGLRVVALAPDDGRRRCAARGGGFRRGRHRRAVPQG